MLDIEKRDEGLIVFRGRLDASQSPKAEEYLDGLEGNVRIDVSELEYISSAGIGVFLKTLKRLQESGDTFQLVDPNPHVKNVFHYAGLAQVMGIE